MDNNRIHVFVFESPLGATLFAAINVVTGFKVQCINIISNPAASVIKNEWTSERIDALHIQNDLWIQAVVVPKLEELMKEYQKLDSPWD